MIIFFKKINYIWYICFILFFLGVATLYFLRIPIKTKEMRGEFLANKLGCFTCHGNAGQGGVWNPYSKSRFIPGFNVRGALMSYIYNEEEIREWILYGAPRRLWEDNKKPVPQGILGGIIKMPAYENQINESELKDLIAYFKSVANLDLPADIDAKQGYDLSKRKGCFGCHGEGGKGGFSNPGSFKNYIPPWNGKDYDSLVQNEDELKEWIYKGNIKRFRENIFARFFISRMTIKMPAYENTLSSEEVEKIISYIKWLRKDNRKKKTYWVDENASIQEKRIERGEFLYYYTGCVACHNVQGIGGIKNPNATGGDVPTINDMAEKLQLFSRKDAKTLLSLMEQRIDMKDLLKKPPFIDFQIVYETFLGTRNLIIKGIHTQKLDPKGPNPPIIMPSWSKRSNSDHSPVSITDIDSIIAYLITLQVWEEEEVEKDTKIEKKLLISNYFKNRVSYIDLIRNADNHGFARVTGLENSPLHGNYMYLFINKSAKSIFKNNHEAYLEEFSNDDEGEELFFSYKPYPVGTIIFTAHFKDSKANTFESIYMMTKKEGGYDSEHGDWRYTKINSKGKITIDGSSQDYSSRIICYSGCHGNISKRDHIFATYLSE